MIFHRPSLIFQCSHEIGFFLLEHDIPESVCQRALSETHQFFQRPLEEKLTISYENSRAFRGYQQLGVENTEGKTDYRDQIEYAAEYRDVGEDNQCRPFYHRLRSTNPWPDAIQPTLRPAIMDYVNGVLKAADEVRDAMCLALKVEPRDIAPLFGNNDEPSFWSMKLVSYPRLEENVDTTTTSELLQQGVGAHTDSNFLTLICQDPNSSGLQVQNIKGGWIDVPPTPLNTLICNIGELAEIWTNGYLLATPHRVLRHSSNTDCRTSLPIFYNPKLDAVLEPINTNDLPWERAEDKQWRRKNNLMMNSVGENSFKSLARSHPTVFEKHHSDLRILEDGTIVERQSTAF